MGTTQNTQVLPAVMKVLAEDERVLFAYLYGSRVTDDAGNDFDIAVGAEKGLDPFAVSSDLQIALHQATGLAPDMFDVHVLTEDIEQADVFGLLFLRGVLEHGRLLKDAAPDRRADYLERYALKYRECEGLIQEVLA